MASKKKLLDMLRFDDKRVMITGAASGIGKATALRFAEVGADLQLIDINYKGLQRVRDEASEFGVSVDIYRVDLAKKSEIDALWERIRGNEPDILINNAGIYPFRDFLDIDEDFFGRIVDINWSSVFWMSQHFIRSRLGKGGVIINIGSVEAILPFEENLAHYTMTKGGVLALTRNLAKKYGRKGFRINAIIPGGIVTPGFKNVAKNILKMDFGLIKTGIEFRWRLPLGRFGSADEVARMIVVLASDLASYVHGALIPVDGGFLSA